MSRDNETTDGSVLSLLLMLKENVMFNLNVAEVMIVDRLEDDIVRCHEINSFEHNRTCVKLQNLELQEGDVVVALFSNTDFRTNLKRIKLEQEPQDGNIYSSHSKDCGIIIGLLYRKVEENNEEE